MRLDTATPALVLTVSADALMHGPLAIVRSLGRLGVPVHVVHPGQRLPVDSSRYLAGASPLIVDAGSDSILDQVIAVARRIGGRPVLIPTDDTAALLVDAHQEMLAPHARFPRRPEGLAGRLASKGELDGLCRAHGVTTPKAWSPDSHEALRAAVTSLPVVVKAVDPLRLRQIPGARSVTVAQDWSTLLGAFDVLSSAGPGNVLVQEYVPGGPEAIWMFNAYFDRDSTCRFGATAVKLRQCPPGTGPTSLGAIRVNPDVWRTAADFLGALGYTGIVDLGFRYDARDGSYLLLDVNPRVGGTFRLFTGRNGLDVVRALYRDLTGQPIPDDAAEEGRCWQDEPHDLLAQAIYRRQGVSSWRTWWASMRAVEERAWFAADDPRPFLEMWRHAGKRAGRGVADVVATRRGSAAGRLPDTSSVPSPPPSVAGDGWRQEAW